jgi:hypothetical protein
MTVHTENTVLVWKMVDVSTVWRDVSAFDAEIL